MSEMSKFSNKGEKNFFAETKLTMNMVWMSCSKLKNPGVARKNRGMVFLRVATRAVAEIRKLRRDLRRFEGA